MGFEADVEAPQSRRFVSGDSVAFGYGAFLQPYSPWRDGFQLDAVFEFVRDVGAHGAHADVYDVPLPIQTNKIEHMVPAVVCLALLFSDFL